jgi:hypothetical protein
MILAAYAFAALVAWIGGGMAAIDLYERWTDEVYRVRYRLSPGRRRLPRLLCRALERAIR